MKARFVELMVLVAILALGVQYARDENGGLSINRALSVDGVRIGMSYEEVLEVRGLPQNLEWEAGSTCFHYGEISSRDVGVWFRAGKVVYVAGRSLALDGVPFEAETKTQVFLDRFGPFEDLMTFMSWSPSAGITFEGHDFYSPERPAELTIGLRDVNLAPPWDSEPGRQGNSHSWEPWSHLLWDRIYVGDLCLGESKERVARDGEFPIFDAGYLRGVRRCQDVQHQVYLEHYPATVWLRIG
ncbi:MAG: hypothetical protein KC800_10900, partial [Candidatus Eremiobacteraeota bacterium]|nr:hypothetical protein [Candidatus Eremiobacteraeota bacterium]